MLTTEQKNAAYRAAKKLWDSLDNAARGELGDALVLGTFNWLDWMDQPHPPGMLAALDKLRMDWEI